MFLAVIAAKHYRLFFSHFLAVFPLYSRFNAPFVAQELLLPTV
jgi:hypothetical protein